MSNRIVIRCCGPPGAWTTRCTASPTICRRETSCAAPSTRRVSREQHRDAAQALRLPGRQSDQSGPRPDHDAAAAVVRHEQRVHAHAGPTRWPKKVRPHETHARKVAPPVSPGVVARSDADRTRGWRGYLATGTVERYAPGPAVHQREDLCAMSNDRYVRPLVPAQMLQSLCGGIGSSALPVCYRTCRLKR